LQKLYWNTFYTRFHICYFSRREKLSKQRVRSSQMELIPDPCGVYSPLLMVIPDTRGTTTTISKVKVLKNIQHFFGFWPGFRRFSPLCDFTHIITPHCQNKLYIFVFCIYSTCEKVSRLIVTRLRNRLHWRNINITHPEIRN
jgi:hypothetical protein